MSWRSELQKSKLEAWGGKKAGRIYTGRVDRTNSLALPFPHTTAAQVTAFQRSSPAVALHIQDITFPNPKQWRGKYSVQM